MTEYTVTYSLDENQEALLEAMATVFHDTKERTFHFFMTLGSAYDISNRLRVAVSFEPFKSELKDYDLSAIESILDMSNS